jgi:hypothetical protein
MAKREEYLITARVPGDKWSEIVKEIRARGGKIEGHRTRPGFASTAARPTRRSSGWSAEAERNKNRSAP